MIRGGRGIAALVLLAVLPGCPPEPDVDLNDDGIVNSLDTSWVAGCIGQPLEPSCGPADVDRDGDADGADFDLVAARFGPMRCNGWEDLCDRRYDEVAYPTAHNAYSTRREGFLAYNQIPTLAQQMEDGVRALMLDSWYWLVGDEVYAEGTYLCHVFCGLGSKPLSQGLAEVRGFLEAHPTEVMTLIFENYISDADMQQAFIDAGLLPPGGDPAGSLLFVHPTGDSGAGWPTLREMIDAGKRLVVLSDTGGGFPWYHRVFDLSFETDFDSPDAASIDCDRNRGAAGNDLFIVNHFISTDGGQPQLAQQVNPNPFLLDKLLECWEEQAHVPNFVTVDHYQIGSLFPVVDTLNWLYGQHAGSAPPW